nr:hypothetical protein OG781_02110 [Streptomyces sp. NBC_00830]
MPRASRSGTAVPDLSINRIRETLAAQDLPDHAAPSSPPAIPWQQAESQLRNTHVVPGSSDDAAIQAHLAAFGDLLHNAALAAPAASKAELHAAAMAFNRSRRSVIRADHQQAAAVRSAAKELFSTRTSADGAVVIDLLVAAIYLAVAAARWHEKRGHEQQAASAERTLHQARDVAQRPLPAAA